MGLSLDQLLNLGEGKSRLWAARSGHDTSYLYPFQLPLFLRKMDCHHHPASRNPKLSSSTCLFLSDDQRAHHQSASDQESTLASEVGSAPETLKAARHIFRVSDDCLTCSQTYQIRADDGEVSARLLSHLIWIHVQHHISNTVCIWSARDPPLCL